MCRIKNIEIWIIALLVLAVFLVGIFYYEILGAIVNVTAFIVSLTIIILILILVIIFSHQDHKKTMPGLEKPKIEIIKKDAPEKKLKVFANDQGYLFETLRNDDVFYNKEFGQVLIFEIYPGVIKGYHLHEKHDEYVTCVKGNIKYVVAKEYPDGSRKINKFVIGEKNPVLIKIPKGLWRGYMPLGNQSAMVMDIMSRPYDSKDPDTKEKDPYEFGDVWTVKKG